MRTLDPKQIGEVVYQAIPKLACELPDDILAGLQSAYEAEDNPRGREILSLLTRNAQIAKDDQVPLCLEAGPDVLIPGDIFSCVNSAVAKAYTEAKLRKSLLRDAFFDRTNTQDNTPAFCEIHLVDEPGVARLHIMLKGGGSDNASRVVMLAPGAGKQGIIDELLDCLDHKAANACPPLIIGIGIGATFDKVGGLAKRALTRPVNQVHPDPQVAAFEAELLSIVNGTGIGPGALGGKTTALGVKVNTAPCHIAALPLAINMGCSAMRRGTYEL